MKDPKEIQTVVTSFLHKLLNDQNIGENDDFFDFGISSLSVVELQLKIEEALEVKIPTSKLMANPTLSGWTALYQDALIN